MAELRQRILEASIAMVAEHGVRSVSFRQVAKRAGVSHQAPYHHFGNVEGILRAIAQEGFGQLADAMERAAEAAGPDPLDALTAAGVAYVRFARDHAGHFRVMFARNLVDVNRPDAPLAEAERTHGTLVRLAAEAVDAGHGRGLDASATTHLCWATVHGLATFLVEGILNARGPLDRAAEDAILGQVVEGLAGLLHRPT